MSAIKLRYVNKSFDVHNEDVLIFLRNEAKMDGSPRCYAWKVIKNCGYDQVHPFLFPLENMISVIDSNGNHSPAQLALPGDRFRVTRSRSGMQLVKCTPKPGDVYISVDNGLELGAIGVIISKSGKALDTIKNIAPGESVFFDYKPVLKVVSVGEITEGKSFSSEVIGDVHTISLYGIESADIVKRGGGWGRDATKITFSLENEDRYDD